MTVPERLGVDLSIKSLPSAVCSVVLVGSPVPSPVNTD